MALELKDFTHEFFSTKSVSAADGTINWASAEGTPTDYSSASTEKVDSALIKVGVTFNASATGDVVIHSRHESDINLNTEQFRIEAPASATPQKKEMFFYGPFKDLDIGVENEDSTLAATVDIDIVDGTKVTGVTAA